MKKDMFLEAMKITRNARDLALMCLQSDRYQAEVNFRDQVDRVLELTDPKLDARPSGYMSGRPPK